MLQSNKYCKNSKTSRNKSFATLGHFDPVNFETQFTIMQTPLGSSRTKSVQMGDEAEKTNVKFTRLLCSL